MWIADHWKDYEVIDTSCGEKLERWGRYILLVRPDPQVIWNTPKRTGPGWNTLKRTLSPQHPRAAVNGNFSICRKQWSISLPTN